MGQTQSNRMKLWRTYLPYHVNEEALEKCKLVWCNNLGLWGLPVPWYSVSMGGNIPYFISDDFRLSFRIHVALKNEPIFVHMLRFWELFQAKGSFYLHGSTFSCTDTLDPGALRATPRASQTYVPASSILILGISRRPRTSLEPGGSGCPFALIQCTLALRGPSSRHWNTTSRPRHVSTNFSNGKLTFRHILVPDMYNEFVIPHLIYTILKW